MSFVGNMLYSGYTTGNPYTEQAVRANRSAGRRKTLRGAQHTRLVHHHLLEEPAPTSVQAALDTAALSTHMGAQAALKTIPSTLAVPRCRQANQRFGPLVAHIGHSLAGGAPQSTTLQRVHSNAAAPSPRSIPMTQRARPQGGGGGAARSPQRSNPIVDSTTTTAPSPMTQRARPQGGGGGAARSPQRSDPIVDSTATTAPSTVHASAPAHRGTTHKPTWTQSSRTAVAARTRQCCRFLLRTRADSHAEWSRPSGAAPLDHRPCKDMHRIRGYSAGVPALA
ncbi:hypothetical protein B0H19DRAFT_1245286 [Mycena capillaripes]|nr:hypothetical protein B0H19DRAFT_1245286 [Mycena capillaripes]